jgi:methenyltetrahydrofolate cyclohydrolase
MRNDTIDSFLAAPADRVPAPGGGASAGLHAAQAAALLAMVARYSDGKRFAVRAELCAAVNEVDRLVQRAERVTAAVRVELAR